MINFFFLISIHSDVIYAMVEEQPMNARRIRYKMTELRILPSLVIRLTVNFCPDNYVDFLNGVFNSQPNWFLQQSYTSGASFTKIKSSILQELKSSMPIVKQESDSINNKAETAAIIRALCGLVAFFGVKLTEQETRQCLSLLAHTSSEMLMKLLLCLVLVSADQMMKYQKEMINIIIQLIQNGSSEMPLLLMAYFQTDEIGQVEDMVRTILRMQVPIPKLGLFEMQKLFKVVDSYI
ncbi:hypothetical protein BC941DRAFT_434172 [Chlamydoabsidia padenii]|nr:hypothetical protein BC941DRAFT_434172 [Chlamydoabsidia padenii]